MTTRPLPFEYVSRKVPAVLELCRRCVASPLHRLDGETRYCPGCGETGPTPGHLYRLESSEAIVIELRPPKDRVC